jgi:hypothetical protein
LTILILLEYLCKSLEERKLAMKIGSEAHKELFCQSFMASHLEYEPETLPWPQLDSVSLERLRGIPFWTEALRTERTAGVMVSAFAETVSDPVLREAIALQGMEETRHGRLIEFLIEHYGIEIELPPAKPIPDRIEQAFIDFGFDECLDSFLAFGLFEIARRSNFFPEPLFTIFDPIMHEEARHIVFFVNWLAYLQVQRGRGAKVIRGANSLWQYSKSLRHVLDIANSSDGSGEAFTATGALTFAEDLTLETFLSTCLEENRRRMSAFDDRLLQPQLMPDLTAFALRCLRLLPRRKPNTVQSPGLS